MISKGKVSVVVPCYNYGHFLEDTLISLENSTYNDLEVIVVDDGSPSEDTKRHLERLQGYQIKGKPVTFLFQENQGVSMARNNGISRTTGEFVFVLDADDMVEPTYIEKAVWVLTRDPEVSIAYSSLRHFGLQDDIYKQRPYDFPTLLEENFINVSSVYRRQVWEDINGYDDVEYEDWDFWIRAGAAGHVGYYMPEPLFLYRKTGNSKLVNANKKRKMYVKILRNKNKQIYKQWQKVNRTSGEGAVRLYLRRVKSKLSVWKWKAFVAYARLASKVPPAIKAKTYGFVKPIVRKVFGLKENDYAGTGVEIEEIEDYLEQKYDYRKNRRYMELITQQRVRADRNRRRILFIVPWMTVGGADKVNYDLASRFVRAGHEVHMFTTLNHEHNWHHKFLEVTPHITHLGNWFSQIDELIDYALDYIQAHEIDVVQVSNSQMGYNMIETLKSYLPNLRVVDLLHAEAPTEPWDYFRYSVRFTPVLDHRIVITPNFKQSLVRKFGERPERISVIPNGVITYDAYEQTGYPEKLAIEQPVVAFVGRMEVEKQPIEFVRVAKCIYDANPNVRFLMIGDGRQLNECKKLAKANRIAHAIEFTGVRDDVLALLQERVHILLQPSLHEGLPIVGLEAMACGIPIVATEVMGWMDLVRHGETGLLAPLGDTKQLAEACLELLVNPEMKSKLSRQAYELAVRHYSLQKMSEEYLAIYETLTHASTPVEAP